MQVLNIAPWNMSIVGDGKHVNLTTTSHSDREQSPIIGEWYASFLNI